jgi:hypothetical protein
VGIFSIRVEQLHSHRDEERSLGEDAIDEPTSLERDGLLELNYICIKT